MSIEGDHVPVPQEHQNAAYRELPESIRAIYSEQEWLWLSDRQKSSLVQEETEPEWSEP